MESSHSSNVGLAYDEDAAQIPAAATGTLTMAKRKSYGRTARDHLVGDPEGAPQVPASRLTTAEPAGRLWIAVS
jgi:hypothetical protein